MIELSVFSRTLVENVIECTPEMQKRNLKDEKVVEVFALTG